MLWHAVAVTLRDLWRNSNDLYEVTTAFAKPWIRPNEQQQSAPTPQEAHNINVNLDVRQMACRKAWSDIRLTLTILAPLTVEALISKSLSMSKGMKKHACPAWTRHFSSDFILLSTLPIRRPRGGSHEATV